MLNLGWKAFGVLLVLSLIMTGNLKYTLLKAEKTIAVQQASIIQYKSNEEKLETAINTQRDTVKTILSINEKVGDRLHEFTNKQQEAMANNAKLNEEINTLRQTEANLALEKPYGRGNAAGGRLNSILRGIGGTSNTKGSGDIHDTSNPQN